MRRIISLLLSTALLVGCAAVSEETIFIEAQASHQAEEAQAPDETEGAQAPDETEEAQAPDETEEAQEDTTVSENSEETNGRIGPLTPNEIRVAQCATDNETPAQWRVIEAVVRKQSNCFGPTRFVNFSEPNSFPDSDFTALPLEQCKLQNIHNYPMLGHASEGYYREKRHPSVDTVVQVVPIYTNDASPKGTPSSDYGQYFDFFMNWIKNTADVPVSAEVRVPESYFYFDAKLSDYPGIERHQKSTSEGRDFVDDVMALVDKDLNFSDVDMTIVIVPPETDNQLLGTNGWAGNKVDYDGNKIWVNFIQTPIDRLNDEGDWQVNFTNPFTMLHEMHHGGQDYGDHGKHMNPYGLMTNSLTNLLVWEKWTSGFIADSQISCVNPSETSMVAIAPSEMKTSRVKGLVIPLSTTEVLVVQSSKAIGYDYKLPDYATGAVVYRIDLSQTAYEEGEYLVSNPSLKVGQSLEYENILITVMDSGDFGEVIKIN